VISLWVAAIVFAFAFGGALVGMSLRERLPETYLSSDSKEVIRITSGLLATLAALVLGLLVASAKSGFDAQNNGFQQLSANIVALDRLLSIYGSEATKAREALRSTVIAAEKSLSDEGEGSGLGADEVSDEGAKVILAIEALATGADSRPALQSQALQTTIELGRTRWLLSEQQDASSLLPFLSVLLLWLFAIFVSFGLFAPRNPAVMTALFISAVSAAGAVFLIVDLSDPSAGLIQVSREPLRSAIAHLDR
jgi:hypothetical protein